MCPFEDGLKMRFQRRINKLTPQNKPTNATHMHLKFES